MSLRETMSAASRKRRAVLALLMLALGAGAALPAAAEDKADVRIAVEGAFPPFNYLDAKNELQGFDVDVAHALCETSKLRCTFVVQAWEGMIPNLLAKRYDAIVSSMSISEERKKKVAFSAQYYNSPTIFVVRKDSPIEDVSPQGLAGKRVGSQPATIQWAYMQENYAASVEIAPFDTSELAYAALLAGDVDAVLDDKLSILDWLTNTKAGRCCRFAGADINEGRDLGEGAGIAFRKEDGELREKFDAALSQIQADGTFDMINAKYFPFSIR